MKTPLIVRTSQTLFLLLLCMSNVLAESPQTRQATPPPSQKMNATAFEKSDSTTVRWLGGGGFFINTRGCCLMIDPVLKDFDLPLLIEMPIQPDDVPRLDGILITHDDADHYSVPTCKSLCERCVAFHSTQYCASRMTQDGCSTQGHDIGDTFEIGSVRVKLTPTQHDWQNYMGEHNRVYQLDDCCGFLLETPDGTIWAPGDTKFMAKLLEMPRPDLILLDISDSDWHLGIDGAVALANAYPESQLILHHWGTVDAPDMKEFNADPKDLEGRVVHPERIHVLAPGAAFVLKTHP